MGQEKQEKFPFYFGDNDADNCHQVIIIRDLLPENNGYRISFVGIDKGLLRRRRFRDKNESIYLSAPDVLDQTFSKPMCEQNGIIFNERLTGEEIKYLSEIRNKVYSNPLGYTENTGRVTDFIYTSEEGYGVYLELGFQWFTSNIYNPDGWDGELIGEGSESLVYKATIAGKNCVVKLINSKGIEKFNKNNFLGLKLDNPQYETKFGVSLKIFEAIKMIQESRAFKSVSFTNPPLDYIAGRNFIIEECVEGTPLDDWIKMNETSEPLFIGELNNEIQEIDDILFYIDYVLSMRHISSPFSKIDFCYKNFLVQGVTEGKLVLCLIDQAPAGVNPARSDEYYDRRDSRDSRFEKVRNKYEKDSVVQNIINNYL